MTLINKIEDKIMPLALKVASNRELTAVRNAMYNLMPFLIIGSFFLLLAALPIPGYGDFMANVFGAGWDSFLTKITDATFGVMTVIVVLATSYYYAESFEMDGLLAPLTSLAFFLVITPFVDGTIPMMWLGAQGMLIGILCGLGVTRFFIYLYNKNLFPQMPEGVPPGVMKSFNSLVPVTLILMIAMIINITMSFTNFDSINDMIYLLLSQPLLLVGNTLPGIVIAEGIASILWVFGIHGNDVVLSVMRPIWLLLSAENLAAVQAGLEPVNIITQQFKDAYLQIGGSGSTLPLLLVILLTSKSKHLRMIAALSLLPGIFNINEPVIFGLPIVLSPIFAIPFIIVPGVYATISYFAMSSGLVALTNGLVIPWTTPVFISGLLVSGPSGLVLQIVLVVVGMAIYYPFVRMADKQIMKRQEAKEN
ncbi:PTS transporter subunit EIIC [Mollicutes bacterium LVI A0039]|nr:PTS transporter subunit EIIC [Mollicutes bacterium LVI A0039]